MSTAPPVPTTPTTLIGPNGTAPGLAVIEQQPQALQDAQPGRAAGAPLAVAALLLLVVFTTVVIRAARAKQARSR